MARQMSTYINPNEKRWENCALSTRTESNCFKIIKKKNITKQKQTNKRKVIYYIGIAVCWYTSEIPSLYYGGYTVWKEKFLLYVF